MKKILITGGAGFIGSHTVVELLGEDKLFEPIIIDNFSNSKKEVIEKIEQITEVKPKFQQIDILDQTALEKLFAENKFDSVIHLAALKSVSESLRKPLEYFESNVVGLLNLLSVMKKHCVKKLIFSSSATVYGNSSIAPYKEDAVVGATMTNPYGETKAVAEKILEWTAKSDQEWQITILRYFNPVGNHPSGIIGEDPNGIPSNLIPVLLQVASGKIPELKIFGDDYETLDGTCLRDYVSVVDIAKGHVAALKQQKQGIEIFNLGTGKALSVKEIVNAFEESLEKILPKKVVARRAGDLPVVFADVAKAEKELGWKSSASIKQIMESIKAYLDKNPQF